MTLERAVLDSLDGLLAALELTPLGDDRFRAHSEPDRFGRVFGGQMIAQAMSAASATVPDKPPHSLHAYFVQAGVPEQPLDLHVDRVRDGRSMSARRVTVAQGGEPLLIAMVSFHDNPTQPEFAEPAPPAPGTRRAATTSGLGGTGAAATSSACADLDRPATAGGDAHRRTDLLPGRFSGHRPAHPLDAVAA